MHAGNVYFSLKQTFFFFKSIPMDMNLNVEAAKTFAAENWVDPVSNIAN